MSAKTAYQVEESFKKNAELLLDKIEKGVINMDNEVRMVLGSLPESRKETFRNPESSWTYRMSRTNPRERNVADGVSLCIVHLHITH